MCIRDRLKRSYEELIEKLELEKIHDMKYLPVVVDTDDYFDDTVVDLSLIHI